MGINWDIFFRSSGFPTNIRNLLESQADDISPLNGYDLVAAKVKEVVWQGGWYPPIHGWGAATFNWACGSGTRFRISKATSVQVMSPKIN